MRQADPNASFFIKEHGQYRQGRAGANRYGMGKTQE